MFPRPGRAELPILVEKDDGAVLHADDHVGLAIPVDILEAQGHHRQIFPLADERWPQVDPGVGGVAARKLDDLDVPGEVEREKVAGEVGESACPTTASTWEVRGRP